ncbi:MAG TPA: host attachment protein [Chthoniobacteraceae bacterium]|nr:host attachment protein [Chthoniobacteraceae bacterium]
MDITVITTNLGHLKAYRVEATPTRGPKLELVENLNFPDAHGRYPADKEVAEAGRFPITQGSGPSVATAAYEALPLELENERRLVRLIAERIEAVLEQEKTEAWYFSARPEIFYAVLNAVAPRYRERMTRSAQADLTKTPVPQVLDFFELP